MEEQQRRDPFFIFRQEMETLCTTETTEKHFMQSNTCIRFCKATLLQILFIEAFALVIYSSMSGKPCELTSSVFQSFSKAAQAMLSLSLP